VRRETFAAPGPLRLEVKLPAGEIEIEAGDTGEAVVELDALRGDERIIEEARVELRGDELRVEVRDRGRRGAEVGLRMAVPTGSALNAATASADLTARGTLGETELKSASADLGLEQVAGLRVKSASGDVHVGHVGGDARVQIASGDVGLARVAGEAEIAAASGDVHVGEAGAALKVQSASGDLRVDRVAVGRVELTSASGDVRVGIQRGSRVFLDIRSASGEVESELEVGDEPTDEEGPLVELKVTTMSGDVSLLRAG
jgi:hypothetical protein